MSHNWPYRGLLAFVVLGVTGLGFSFAQVPIGPIGGAIFSGILGDVTVNSLVVGSPTGGNEGAGSINTQSLYINGGQVLPLTAGTGIDFNSNIVTPHAIEHISWVSTIANALTTNFGGLHKFSAASTVDNGVLSVEAFTCTGNPSLLALNCHADNTCGTSPTTIATVTPSAAGITDLTISSSAIAANEYVGFHQTGGTCTVLNLQMTLQVHAN